MFLDCIFHFFDFVSLILFDLNFFTSIFFHLHESYKETKAQEEGQEESLEESLEAEVRQEVHKVEGVHGFDKMHGLKEVPEVGAKIGF